MGGAFGAIKAMDKAGTIPDEEIPMLVANWRRASPNICRFWKEAEAAAKTAIRERRKVKLKNGLTFSYINKILFIRLLSGRKLAYFDARLEETEQGESITYAVVEQQTKRWGRLETWGGKLAENIVQATARDCLAVTMTRVSAAGYGIVMHVHDEIIVDVPVDDKEALSDILRIMSMDIPWAPGLPLKGTATKPIIIKKIRMGTMGTERMESCKMKHDGIFQISVGRSRMEKLWKNKSIAWSQLLAKLRNPTRTQETYGEYLKLPKEQQDSIKRRRRVRRRGAGERKQEIRKRAVPAACDPGCGLCACRAGG